MQAQWEHQLLNLAGNIPQLSIEQSIDDQLKRDHIRVAYLEAADITRRNSKSFYFASRFLPDQKRSAVQALYAFCRTVDDLVDQPASQDSPLRLESWREIVRTGKAAQDNLVGAAWTDTLNRYRIPRQYALQLIDGVARDLVQTRYQTFEELTLYCYAVASTVGLMSMYIIGFWSQLAVPYAIKLGVALQMTNILRDVGEDFRRGRIYLPREELINYGIREAEIAEGRITDRWRRFMRFQIERTRQLYADSWEGVKLLSQDGRLAIRAASIFYRGILDEIEKNDFDVFSRRASLTRWGKISRLPAVWL